MRVLLLILGMSAANFSVAESFRCGRLGIDFEIKDGQLISFNAQKAIEDKDLANGYSLTCVQHIDKFSRSSRSKEHVLRFNVSDDQYGESQDCRVFIKELASKFRVQSSECRSECMNLNFEFEKKGKECYHVP